jgi:tRNA G10  N-methylase Trm11
MQSILLLGRQPALGLAELESLYGSAAVRKVGATAAVVDVDPCLLAFDRLGGSIKFCKILASLETINWKEIEKFVIKVAPGHSQQMPEGKMHLGLSVQGIETNIRQIEATGLNIKKAIRKTGRSVRLVPNKELELSSAQVHHNKLTTETGWELVFIRDGDNTIVAQTVKVQDIASYTVRDRERPKRDARVGMLPPKLAQIILNLSTGKIPEEQLSSICDIPADATIPRPKLDKTVLDPFCGTGVLLQEAILMGYDAYGSDIDKRMVDYTTQNLDWLKDMYTVSASPVGLEIGDATNHQWTHTIDFVACETYLGKPFTGTPDPQVLAQTIGDCNLIIKKFLHNLWPQLKPGARLCLAVPAWNMSPTHASTTSKPYLSGPRPDAAHKSRGTQYAQAIPRRMPERVLSPASVQKNFRFLPLIDQIEDLGYNRVSFEHVPNADLLYYRADQTVARQLIVLTKR